MQNRDISVCILYVCVSSFWFSSWRHNTAHVGECFGLGVFPLPQLPETIKAPLPLHFFPLASTNQYAIGKDPCSMSEWAKNSEISSSEDCFALQVNGELMIKDPLPVTLAPTVAISAPQLEGSGGSAGSESLCFRVNHPVHFQGIGLPHNLFANGEQTGVYVL